jgi:hypothetical protein
MNKIFLTLLVLLTFSMSFAQEQSIVRIKIRHSDPMLIMMLLNGTTTFNTPPEISSGTTGFRNGYGGGSWGSNSRGGFNGYGGSRNPGR